MSKGDNSNVRQQRDRREEKKGRVSYGQPWQDLDFFPTPPWATRALFEIVLPRVGVQDIIGSVWDPCAGLGHMADTMRDYARVVTASDVYLYERERPDDITTRPIVPIDRHDFLMERPDYRPSHCDWLITNPPFNAFDAVLARAFEEADAGVALLLRLSALPGQDRFTYVFDRRPPAIVAPFAERVPMFEGGWDPAGSTPTDYAWFVWTRDTHRRWEAPQRHPFPCLIIPPGQRDRLSRPDDRLLAARHVPGFQTAKMKKSAGADQERMQV